MVVNKFKKLMVVNKFKKLIQATAFFSKPPKLKEKKNYKYILYNYLK